MQAVIKREPKTALRVIVFPNRMATLPSSSVEPDPPQAGYNPQKHGTWAQWASPFMSLVAVIISITSVAYFHYADRADKNADKNFTLNVNDLIDRKLDPKIAGLNSSIVSKLDKIDGKLDMLSHDVDELQGRFKQIDAEQKKIATRVEQTEALARVRKGPDDTLDGIRKELQLAQNTGKEIPYGKLVDFKLAVRGLPSSAADYWKTVATIINYGSFLDQTQFHAPDPATISHPCHLVTRGESSDIVISHNTVSGSLLLHCYVDLDDNAFSDTTFQDSVIRYHGGRTFLHNVTFLNCRFVLDIPADTPMNPDRERLLLAMLNSTNTRSVKVSTHS